MYISKSGSKNSLSFYLCESYRKENGKNSSRIVESLGTVQEIMERYHVNDAATWCKEYCKKKNAQAAQLKAKSERKITIELSEVNDKDSDSRIYNAGVLILDKLYHEFGLSNICHEIQAKYTHVRGYKLDHVLKIMLYGRIIEPSSKRWLSLNVQQQFIDNSEVQLQHIYRAMDHLEKHSDLIQDRLYYYTNQAIGRNVNRLYYDCTNFFTEIERADSDVEGRDEYWCGNHTLRMFGLSKEHRPNPIVQMGLFMDGDGMPLGMCINPGNTNETKTMKPLEEKLVKNFSKTDLVVCTDAALASYENRKLNNVTKDDPAVPFNLKGQRHFIYVQPIKKVSASLQSWALDHKGWSYREKSGKGSKTVTDFDLDTITEENYSKYHDITFYKERTSVDHEVEQRLIVSFSLAYKEYMRALRNNKIKRASAMIANGTYKRQSESSPRSLIKEINSTQSGEIATAKDAEIDHEKIEQDEKYDGFYCLTTNLFKDECSIHQIVAIGARRWEIEECFRIMKSDLQARPFFHNKDNRIIAHFMICFMALLLVRGIEHKISSHVGPHERYPDGKYTVSEILNALRTIRLISLKGGQGYQPDYKNSEVISTLLEVFDLKELSKEVIMKDTLRKIFKRNKISPEMYSEKT